MPIDNYQTTFDIKGIKVNGVAAHLAMADLLTWHRPVRKEVDYAIACVHFVLNVDGESLLHTVPFKLAQVHTLASAKHNSAKKELLHFFARSGKFFAEYLKSQFKEQFIVCEGIVLDVHACHVLKGGELPDSSTNPRAETLQATTIRLLSALKENDIHVADRATFNLRFSSQSQIDAIRSSYESLLSLGLIQPMTLRAADVMAFKSDPARLSTSVPKVDKLPTDSDNAPAPSPVQRPMRGARAVVEVALTEKLPKTAAAFRADENQYFQQSDAPNFLDKPAKGALQTKSPHKKEVNFAETRQVMELSQAFSTQSLPSTQELPSQQDQPPQSQESLLASDAPSLESPRVFSQSMLVSGGGVFSPVTAMTTARGKRLRAEDSELEEIDCALVSESEDDDVSELPAKRPACN